jgi:hypothetical protein
MNRNDGRATDAAPDEDNNLGRGAPGDREERVRQKRRNEARSIEQNPQYQSRRPHDLDREDAELQREGAAQQKPGVRLSKEERSEQQERQPNGKTPPAARRG